MKDFSVNRRTLSLKNKINEIKNSLEILNKRRPNRNHKIQLVQYIIPNHT